MTHPNVLVLGGTGFVGRNVLEFLEQSNFTSLSVSRASGTDLRDPVATAKLFRQHKPEVIINCAAHVGSLNYVTRQAAEIVSDNTRIILALYEAVANECPGALIINPIANCAYPATVSTFEEDHLWDGALHRSVLSFGSTRRFLWATAECFRMQHGIRSVHFLVPNMYGPYDSTDPDKAHALNALVAKFVKAVNSGAGEVAIWGSGVAIREWLYAPDFARVVIEVLKDPKMIGLTEPLNVAQNFGLSVREIVDLVAGATDFKGEIIYDHMMPDGAPRKVMDDRRFRKVFPNFAFTPLHEGIQSAIVYYRTLLSTAPKA